MSRNLGEFGIERESIDAAFSYFGSPIRVNPDVSELDFVDLAEDGADIKEDDPRSVTILKEFVRKVVHPEDFDHFWALAKQHRQTTIELMGTTKAVMEAVTERPTGQPPTSLGGRRKTRRRSKGRSYDPAFRVLAGRPDLQDAVALRLEARHAG